MPPASNATFPKDCEAEPAPAHGGSPPTHPARFSLLWLPRRRPPTSHRQNSEKCLTTGNNTQEKKENGHFVRKHSKSAEKTVLATIDWQKEGHPFGCPSWCARGESNPHARNEHRHLKPASLPIPPLAHFIQAFPERLIIIAPHAKNVNSIFSVFQIFFQKRHRSSLRTA